MLLANVLRLRGLPAGLRRDRWSYLCRRLLLDILGPYVRGQRAERRYRCRPADHLFRLRDVILS